MAEVRHVLWIVLLLNLLVALAKFFYGLATNSHSMQADGIHSVFDSMGNVVGLVGITLALRPADEGHPYGHFKFETYASMVIGVLLIEHVVDTVGNNAQYSAGDKGSLVDYQRFRSKFHSGECGHDKKSKEHPDKACARRCRAVQFHHFNQWPNKPPQYARRQNLQDC